MNKYKKYNTFNRNKRPLRQKQKKGRRPYYQRTNFYKAVLHIYTSFNNTKFCLSDIRGNVFFTSSCGILGFKGYKKRDSKAILKSLNQIISFLHRWNITQIYICFKGVSHPHTRTMLAEYFEDVHLKIRSIKEYKSIPHNGCRLPKQRRL